MHADPENPERVKEILRASVRKRSGCSRSDYIIHYFQRYMSWISPMTIIHIITMSIQQNMIPRATTRADLYSALHS